MKAAWDYVIDSLVNITVGILVDLYEIGRDLILGIAVMSLEVMSWGIKLVKDRLPKMDTTGMWDKAPEHLIQILTYLDFHVCIALVTASIGIRFSLNFVPFAK